MPKEAADVSKYDPKNTAMATGPFYLQKFSDTELNFKRNPGFKRAALKDNEPYIDEIYDPVITDNSQVLAQMRTGAIYEANITPDAVLQLKADAPQLLMYQTEPTTNERVYFGHNPDSPFRDERLRIAYFKTIDRDAYIPRRTAPTALRRPACLPRRSGCSSHPGRATSLTPRAW